MLRKLRFALFAHSFRSDWNNGNAHFLRGLARELGKLGHTVICYEQTDGWSYSNLLAEEEERGAESLQTFAATYPDLQIELLSGDNGELRSALSRADIALVHEWHTPETIADILAAREGLPCRLLFHDTHHRASSSPEQIRLLQVHRFDGVVAFGEALRAIYREHFGLSRVWTLHEAADTTIFFPQKREPSADVVWVGNWGDNERSQELCEYLVEPARRLQRYKFLVHGVRYPAEGRAALKSAGITFGGYLPNLNAPAVYNRSRLTMHVPRQQYSGAMAGIPTIRVFEALAAGIPLISASWLDAEGLFRPEDFRRVNSGAEMTIAIKDLLEGDTAAAQMAEAGLATIRARHTCRHRADELTGICEEVLA
ncbi:MAG: CgeB family protein [Acidobacteriaceae bacterium]